MPEGAELVVELGAGTGKLTRAIAGLGVRVVAVEPDPRMLAVLRSRGLEGVEGSAEAIPLRDGVADAVVAGSSLHWFELELALPEIHRVLRPGGGLGLIWNVMGSDPKWLAALRELVHGIRGSVPAYGVSPWQEAFRATPLFRPLTQRTFDLVHELDEDGLVDRIVSTSYVAALPDADRARLVDQVRALVRDVPRPLRLPYRTDVFTYRGT